MKYRRKTTAKPKTEGKMSSGIHAAAAEKTLRAQLEFLTTQTAQIEERVKSLLTQRESNLKTIKALSVILSGGDPYPEEAPPGTAGRTPSAEQSEQSAAP